MRVLVTYGRHSKTLSAVRSIGGSRREVIVSDSMRSPLAAYSRYCSDSFVTASPKDRPDEFLREIEEASTKKAIDLLIPMDDPECDLLCKDENRARLKCPVALPSQEVYETARVKHRTIRLAQELGLRVPRSAIVEEPGRTREAAREIGFPLVLKPVRSSGSRGFMVLEGEKDLPKVPKVMDKYGTMLAQEFIPNGGSVGVSYLFNSGETRAVFSHRRLLEYPESGGPSIVRESIRHEEAEEAGLRLLQRMKWHGVAMVEFRIDSRNGKPVLIEVNPRFWGSLPLAIASGVDFPRLLCDMYEHGDVPVVSTYDMGVKCVNLLPLGMASIMASNGARRACDIARNAVRSGCFDVESLEDPMPTLGALISMFEYVGDKSKRETFFGREH